MNSIRPKSIAVIACALLAGGCANVGPAPDNAGALPPVRFLLTFDDGPSGALSENPTELIVNTLAANPTQPGIKALFFVQTRWPGAGGSAVGQRLIKRMVREGHALGVHSGTVRGHINHRTMSSVELKDSLVHGDTDIHHYSGDRSGLVRPTYWAFDERTLDVYRHAGVSMLLTDLRARDGIFTWYQDSPHSGGRLHRDFRFFQQRAAAGRVAAVDGVTPVVVTFHDTNPYTAKHLAEYLETLIKVARDAGVKIADPPFYSDRDELLQAARARTVNKATRADIAP